MREHGRCRFLAFTAVCAATFGVAEPAVAQEMPAPYQAVLKELGRKGDLRMAC